jgi:hypothetical protein
MTCLIASGFQISRPAVYVVIQFRHPEHGNFAGRTHLDVVPFAHLREDLDFLFFFWHLAHVPVIPMKPPFTIS